MKKGFDRLKGVAAASAIGFGLIGVGGSARAAFSGPTRPLGFTHRISLAATVESYALSASFTEIGGTSTDDTFDINEFSVWAPGASFVTDTWPAGSSTTWTTHGYSTPTGSPHWTTTTVYYTGPTCSNSWSGPSGTSCHLTVMGTTITSSTFVTTYAGPTVTNSWSSGSSTSDYAYQDAFDGVLGMEVEGNTFMNPDNDIDFTDGVVTSDVVNNIVGGIDAQIKYAFSGDRTSTALGGVAAMYILSNNSGTEKTITVNINGNLGSDEGTMIQATDSGDFVADDADRWTISSENARGEDPMIGDDPVLLITRYGKDATVVPTQTDTIADENGYFANDYELTIPAGETQRIVVIIEAHKTIAGAEAAAADFETMTAAKKSGLLDNLTTDEIKEVVNYKYVAPSSSDSGATGLPALLGLLGIPALLRRFRKGK